MWVDGPFFDILSSLMDLQGYFIQQAWFIGRIVMIFAIGINAIKYAIKGEGLKEPLVKLAIAFISFYILINAFPRLINGLTGLVSQWAVASTNENISDMIDQTQDNYNFWQEKLNKDAEAYSDIIQVIDSELGSGDVGRKYVLDIFDLKSGYLRPNAYIRLIMLIVETIFNRAGKYSLFTDADKLLLLLLTGIAVILCGILGGLQYFICALEFTFISSVGIIMLPFMLWDGSKFLTEKLIGAIVGFTLKLLFVSIALLFTFNGYLSLMVRNFEGTLDQIVYVIFVSLFYMMICQSGPQLAVSMLTGTPQMSLMEGAAAAGAYATAAIAGGRAADFGAHKLAQGGIRMAGATSQAAGAAGATAELGGSRGDQAKAAFTSIGKSAQTGFKSTAHALGRSLYAGESQGTGGKDRGTNRFSQTTRLNEKTEAGYAKTAGEYTRERYRDGQEIGLAYLVKKEEKEKASGAVSSAQPGNSGSGNMLHSAHKTER
jgi:type IV secretory pathway TrbL component